MIQIRYEYHGSVALSGGLEDLERVRSTILSFLDTGTREVRFEVDADYDPRPYDSALSAMIVRKGSGPTCVTVGSGGELVVEGEGKNLEAFASFFRLQPDRSEGAHVHYEYYEGNRWVSRDSLPMEIELKQGVK